MEALDKCRGGLAWIWMQDTHPLSTIRFSGTAVYVPSINAVAFYGGKEA